MRSRNERRVLGAPRTRMEEMVHGKVELSSIYSMSAFLDFLLQFLYLPSEPGWLLLSAGMPLSVLRSLALLLRIILHSLHSEASQISSVESVSRIQSLITIEHLIIRSPDSHRPHHPMGLPLDGTSNAGVWFAALRKWRICIVLYASENYQCCISIFLTIQPNTFATDSTSIYLIF